MAFDLLYQNFDSTIVVIDIPRSIEIAQGLATSSRRLLSSEPLRAPHPSVEPKSEQAREKLRQTSLSELLLSKHLELALDQVKAAYQKEWCLPRSLSSEAVEAELNCKMQKNEDFLGDNGSKDVGYSEPQEIDGGVVYLQEDSSRGILHHNPDTACTSVRIGLDDNTAIIPPESTLLCGDIPTTTDIFLSFAPKFDLIIIDPPWPNRSARKKRSYGISYGNTEIKELLSSIPVHNHLADDGLIGIWITNKSAFREIILQTGGLFDEWGVILVEEWIWLKTTTTGEPICALDSVWRKPYEILLVGRKEALPNQDVKRRVLIGVPDLHSRKPNLKSLFEQIMQKGTYEALEIFARNMTAGWWAWGNEVLKFQMDECWTDGDGK